MLLDFHNNLVAVVVNLQRGLNNRKGKIRELNVHDRSHYLYDFTYLHSCLPFPALFFSVQLSLSAARGLSRLPQPL